MTAFTYENGKKRFLHGTQAEALAAAEAERCAAFVRDCEEECFSAAERSCYNCRWRRWLPEGFQCMKGDAT